MPADHTAPTVDQVREIWAAYRAAKPGSMRAVAEALLTPLEALQAHLKADQQAAQAEFERQVNARYSVKFPMVDAHGYPRH